MTPTQKYKRKKNVLQNMLSVTRISKKYGFHPNTVRSWVTRDGLKAVRHGPGRKIFIKQDDVEAFIKRWYEIDEGE